MSEDFEKLKNLKPTELSFENVGIVERGSINIFSKTGLIQIFYKNLDSGESENILFKSDDLEGIQEKSAALIGFLKFLVSKIDSIYQSIEKNTTNIHRKIKEENLLIALLDSYKYIRAYIVQYQSDNFLVNDKENYEQNMNDFYKNNLEQLNIDSKIISFYHKTLNFYNQINE